jgi:FkbM family methyltransferase
VYAFEASEETCKKFARNLRYNATAFNRSFGNVELVSAALGDRVVQGLEEVLYFSGGPDDGRVCDTFDFITLDQFCDSRGLERLDLIKTDVDGWDYEVLLGAKDCIRRFKPVIIAEVNYALGWRGHSEEDVRRLLKDIGYRYELLDYPSPTNWLMQPDASTESCARP